MAPERSPWDGINRPVERRLVVGFHDLTLYTRWAEDTPPLEVLSRLDAHMEAMADHVNAGGGRFIKAIGDAGLFAFPAAATYDMDHAVETMGEAQAAADAWLVAQDMPCRVVVRMNLGVVACGPVGAAGDKRFDIYGDVVNKTALLAARRFAIGTALFDRCSGPVQATFGAMQPGARERVPVP